jgi:N-acetylmuramoyl-L-alanine amidase
MHPKNKAKADYLRLTSSPWKDFDGTGITIAVWEDISQGHGKGSMDTIRQLAPGATVISRPRRGYQVINGQLTPESEAALIADYREQLAMGVSIVTLSKIGGDCKALAELQRRILVEEGGATLLTAAGNDSEEIGKSSAAYYDDTWLAVGAAYLTNGRPVRTHYSNKGPKLDALMFEGWYNDLGVLFTGTSSASPALAACLARYHQWFKEVYGRTPTQEESWEFIRANCEDLGDVGRDNLTGWGLFRLPAKLPEVRQPVDLEPPPVEPPPTAPDLPTIPDEPIPGGDRPMIVCIDPGHGGPDPGAVSPEGIQEKKITLTVAKRVAEYLRRAGVQVALTRDTDKELVAGNDDSAELRARAKVANDAKADYFLSIHCNAATSSEAEGFELFCYPGSIVGAVLANRVAHSYGIASGLPCRRVEGANFQVLRDTAMPASLIELGFLTNKADCALLKEPAFLDKCALGIAFGILAMRD